MFSHIQILGLEKFSFELICRYIDASGGGGDSDLFAAAPSLRIDLLHVHDALLCDARPCDNWLHQLLPLQPDIFHSGGIRRSC